MSTLHSIAAGASLLFFLKTAGCMFACLLAFSLGKKEEVGEVLYLVFILGGLGACAAGYLFWIVAGRNFPYLTSTFYQSDVFAGYLLLIIPLAASMAVFSEGTLRRLIYLVATYFFILTLFFTYSRGAILVFLIVAALWAFLVYKRKPRVVKYGGGVMGFVIVCAGAYVTLAHGGALLHSLQTKIMSQTSWDVAMGARLSFWRGALLIFLRHPWLGSGPDTFGRLFPLYQERFYWYSRFPHNFYLQTLSDQGIFSFALNVGFLATILLAGVRSLRREGESFPIVLALFLGFLGGCLHLFLDVDSNFFSWQILFWAEGGLLLAHGFTEGRKGRFFSSGMGLKWVVLVSLILITGLKLSVEAADVFDHRAFAAEAKGEYEEALRQERLAILFSPLESEYRDHKARLELALYARTGEKRRVLDARGDLEAALLVDPVKPVYLDELAGIAASLPHGNRRAMELMEKALALDPLNYPEHYVTLANLQVKARLARAARRNYREVIRRYPEDEILRLFFFRRDDFQKGVAMAHLGLGRLDIKENRLHEASAEIQAALRLAQANPEVNYYAGILALYDRRWGEAGDAFQKAVYDPALGADAWRWLSLCDLRLKESDHALSAVKAAFRNRNPDASLYTIAGDIYAMKKEPREAIGMWKRALVLDPGNRFLLERIRRIR